MAERSSSHTASLVLILVAGWFLVFGLCEGARAAGDGTLRGDGSTLVDPLMRKWISEYKRASGVTIEYESNGSGKGISDMTDRSVDFGCSDAPMSDEELKAAAKVGGALVLRSHHAGFGGSDIQFTDLKKRFGFSGRLLARIFLGQLHRWNDPELAALNPGVPLPDREIAAVHRLDSSGTTYVWTEYLSKVSPEWQSKVGLGKTVPWPVGLAAKGNEGVAGLVKQTPWSIGYAQVTYGIRESLEYGRVENAAGEFVEPLPAAITAAAEGVITKLPEDLRFSMTDGPGLGSFPISTVTWALVYTTPPDGKGKELGDFLRWIIHHGQQYAESLDVAPLPQPLVDRGDAKTRGLVDQ